MAVDSSTQPGRDSPELLQSAYAMAAAVASIVASLAAMAGLAWVIMAPAGDDPAIAAPIIIWLVMFVAAVAVARQLLTGRQWAQQVLLAFWELLGIGSVCVLLGGALYGSQPGFALGGVGGSAAAAGVLVAACVVSGLLIAASLARSRLRYGSIATTSVGLAIAVILAVNIVAQHDYVRTSVASYGMYRLSDRTRTVIDGLDEPVKLTCVYVHSASDRGSRYGGRTYELLEEMADYASRRGKQLEVLNADTDSEKFAVIAAIEDKVSVKAALHIAYLQSFVAAGADLVAQLRAHADRWRLLPGSAYVNQWSVGDNAQALAAAADRLEALRSRLAGQLGSPGPAGRGEVLDYARLVDEVTAALNATHNGIAGVAYGLQQIRSLAETAVANRPGVVEAIDRLTEARQAMVQAAGSSDDPAPADPQALLAEFVRRANIVAQRAQTVADLLDGLAGPGNNALLQASGAWWVELRDSQGVVGRMWPPVVMATLGQRMGELAQGIDAALDAATQEYLAEQVTPLRQEVALYSEGFADASLRVLSATERLTDVDQASQQIMAAADSGEFMQDLLADLAKLLQQAGKLLPLEDETLPQDLKKNNVVIVEIHDDIEVIPFEAIWPMAGGPGRAYDGDERRLFNGNAAISSKLLSMTSNPFALVIVTYYRPAGEGPRAPIEPSGLSTLYSRLSENNIEVLFWNVVSPIPDVLARDEAGRATYSGTPTVLLVLPPRQAGISLPDQPAPSFGPRHLAKIKQVIDSGTPAVFLASHLGPTPYQFDEYLRQEWGIGVLSEYTIVPAIPDQTEPGKFMLNYRWMGHLPLNLFADHPIGEPITGQRTLWVLSCPIEIASRAPAGVSVEPLLAIPAAWGDRTWATSHVRRLMEQSDLGLISPDYAQGDLPIPDDDVGMPVAVAASREASPGSDDPAHPAEGSQPVRIVVLGASVSFMDGYIDAPPRAGGDDPKGAGDPPRANAELVINSVLWTIGRDDLIAAGPPRARPIRAISPKARAVLQLLCVVVLPVAIVAIGGAVMIVRRR